MLMMFIFACTEPLEPENLYSTQSGSETIDTNVNEPQSTEPSSDTAQEDGANKLGFRTTNISCAELQNFEFALTQITPGGLEPPADADDDVQNDLLAEVGIDYFRVPFLGLKI